MARINLTLNQDEVLQMLQADTGDAFRVLLEQALNSILRAESAQQINAERYERTESRMDCRNGVRSRSLITRIGKIELSVPRHRNIPFKSLIFENYKRSEAALITTMAEMVVAGVSTAKVGRVMEDICGKNFSKQTVSEACKELDEMTEEFRSRPLDRQYLFVMADATYIKVRENHKVTPKALMIAIGFTREGRKEIIGVDLKDAETTASWKEFLSSLRSRGLKAPMMFTSDSHEGLTSALQDIFPEVPWQRCQAHFCRNITEQAPKSYRSGLRSELTEMFNSSTIEQARQKRDEIIADYADIAPKAMDILDAGFEDSMTVMEIPEDMRRSTRTSNYLERLNKEVKRRTKVIGIFPNAKSALRLVAALLSEENDRWASMKKQYYSPAVEELERKRSRLMRIAQEQIAMRKAA